MDKTVYDVGLSYASEQREYVQIVAERLRDNHVKVFYDMFEVETIWGKNVNDWFYEIFRHKLKYCVIFISKDYVKKANTHLEYEAMLARHKEQLGREYILPVYCDDSVYSPLEGLGYVCLDSYSPQQLADMLINKVKKTIEERSLITVKSSYALLSELYNEFKKNSDTIAKVRYNSSLELIVEIVRTKKFYSLKFQIGGFYKDENKILLIENFSSSISPNGVLSGLIHLENDIMTFTDYGFAGKRNTGVIKLFELKDLINNRLLEIAKL